MILMAALKKELESAREEIKEVNKVNEELTTENTRLCEENEQFTEKNRQLSEERESFASQVEYLQAELTENQMSSQREIEQLSQQLVMLKKDAELEQLHAVDVERRKWEAKEERLSRQLDAALRKLERAEEQRECARQHKGSALPRSFDELSSYSGPVVSSPEPEIVVTSQESSQLSSEQPPTLTSVSTPHLTESVTMPELNSVPSILDVTTSQPFSVRISGLSSVPTVTHLIMSNLAQPHTAPLRFPLFSTAALLTQGGQEMTTRPLYSLVTEPSVSWAGQRPPLSTRVRHTMTCTPGEFAQVSDNTI